MGKCQMTDQEWEKRQKTRQEEMGAVSEAIAILSTDDAHDLFTRTFNPPSFLQKKVSLEKRGKASKLLLSVAHKLHNPKLAVFATRVKLDAFTRVKKAIDDMVTQLLKEKDDEIKHKDFCADEFNTNELQRQQKDQERAELSERLENLKSTIHELKAAIDKEKQDFQKTLADQQETHKLLVAALQALKKFYAPKPTGPPITAFVNQPAGPPPPQGFQAYKKNSASGGVLSLIQQIINDVEANQVETTRDEKDAQTAYDNLVTETSASIKANNEGILNKSQMKAAKEVELTNTKDEHAGVLLGLEQLSNYNAEMHQNCDFVVKNFDIRQT